MPDEEEWQKAGCKDDTCSKKRSETAAAIIRGLTKKAQQDPVTEWPDPSNPTGASIPSPPDVWGYFRYEKPDGFKGDPYYAAATDIMEDALYEVAANDAYNVEREYVHGDPEDKDTATFKSGDVMSTSEFMKLLDEEELQKYIDELYGRIVVSKAKGDNRWRESLPPEGFNQNPNALGAAAAKDLAEAIKKADADAVAAYLAKQKAASAAPDPAKTLGFREQCFLLSQIVHISEYKVHKLEPDASVAAQSGKKEEMESAHPLKTRPYTDLDGPKG